MPAYYYTYGTSHDNPYCGGWTKITAPDRSSADNIFRAIHPSLPGHGITLNCAFTYDEESFVKTEMYQNNNNFDIGCIEDITVNMSVSDKANDKFILSDNVTAVNKLILDNGVVIFQLSADKQTYTKLFRRVPTYDRDGEHDENSNNLNHISVAFSADRLSMPCYLVFDDEFRYRVDIYRTEMHYIAHSLIDKLYENKDFEDNRSDIVDILISY